MKTSIYIHIPFCLQRCDYCDFSTWSGLDYLIPRYIQAVIRELNWISRWQEWQATTVYLGGGTPSVVPPDLIAALLDAIRIEPGAEVSMEANPGTLQLADLVQLNRVGVNRLSLGMQSSRPAELSLLGRKHDLAAVRNAVSWSRKAGFGNVNLDLIFGLPGQTLDEWMESITVALSFSPDHLSLYALTIEPGTRLAKRVASGDLAEPDPDLVADMYKAACELLPKEGFEHYEISNWSRTGFQCRHNLAYWRNEIYQGMGASAYGHWPDGGASWRLRNVLHPREYIQKMERSVRQEVERIPITPATDLKEYVAEEWAMAETMFMGMRLVKEGVSRSRFMRRFGRDILQVYGRELNDLASEKMVIWDENHVRLLPRALFISNQVFTRFLPE